MLRPDHLGLAFRFLRTSRQLRQHQVAEAAGVTPSMLSGYENGRKLPTLATLEKILLAMDCTLRDLVNALELVRDGKSGPQLDTPAAAPRHTSRRGGRRNPPAAFDAPRSFDLDAIFGAEPLAAEEEEAFGEMLRGYCRWLRFLRRQGQAGKSVRQSGEANGD